MNNWKNLNPDSREDAPYPGERSGEFHSVIRSRTMETTLMPKGHFPADRPFVQEVQTVKLIAF
jgi:hypothetical protein